MPRIHVKETFYNFICGTELGAQKGRRGSGMGGSTITVAIISVLWKARP